MKSVSRLLFVASFGFHSASLHTDRACRGSPDPWCLFTLCAMHARMTRPIVSAALRDHLWGRAFGLRDYLRTLALEGETSSELTVILTAELLEIEDLVGPPPAQDTIPLVIKPCQPAQ